MIAAIRARARQGIRAPRRRGALPAYPHAIEREYEALARRVARKAVQLARRVVRGPLSELAAEQRRADQWAPGWGAALLDARIEFMRWLDAIEVDGRLVAIGEQLDAFAAQAIHRQLPAVIPLDMVRGAGITDGALDEFAREGVDLIRSIGSEHFDRIESVVSQGLVEGRRHTSLAKEIQRIGGVTQRRAEFIARDQVAKLNGRIQEERQRALGGETYIWRTSRDSRVRERHQELDGTVQRWDDPPVLDERTGRRGHPGFDFQCRCRAELPVDDILAALEAEDTPPVAPAAEFVLPAAAMPDPMAPELPAVMQFAGDPLGMRRRPRR